MQELTLVLVKWRDAHADQSGSWVRLDDIDSSPLIVHTVGVLLPNHAKPGHTSVAQSWVDSMFDSVLHIPKKMVESVTVLTTLSISS